jgi:hypothetical protein
MFERGPQVDQTIACRGAGQAYDAAGSSGRRFIRALKRFDLWFLNDVSFVDDHHVECRRAGSLSSISHCTFLAVVDGTGRPCVRVLHAARQYFPLP